MFVKKHYAKLIIEMGYRYKNASRTGRYWRNGKIQLTDVQNTYNPKFLIIFNAENQRSGGNMEFIDGALLVFKSRTKCRNSYI